MFEQEKIDFGRRLQKAREDADITQEAVASAIAVSSQTISHYENGRAQISPFAIPIVANLIGVDPGWLLTGKDRTGARRRGKETATSGVPKVPLTELLRFAGMLADLDLVPNRKGEVRFVYPDRVPTRSKVSGIALGFDAFDRAMAPEIETGDLVIVDCAVDFEKGDIGLFALLASGELLLRYCEPIGKEPTPLQPPFILTAANPRFFPARRVTRDHVPIFLGPVVEHTRIRRAMHHMLDANSRQD
jgi:transcriptional regulator with XRE-family HTH domain